jgi:restriction system protein
LLKQDHHEAGEKWYDAQGRPYVQMTLAARSGRQNIIDGSERSSTCQDTEMKLNGVASASLRGDDEVFILDRGGLLWSVQSPEAQDLNAISIDQLDFTSDADQESAKHASMVQSIMQTP